MREFTKRETEIMDYICGLDVLSEDIAISSIITKFCHCSFQCQNNTLTISFNQSKHSEKEVINDLLTILCLFEYLKANSLIYIFLRTNISERKEIINVCEQHVKFSETQISEQRTISLGDNPQVTINEKTYHFDNTATGISLLSKIIIPWDIVDLFMTYANSVIFCTETLRHLKGQQYLEDGTVQFRKNRRQTWWAIGISFFVGIAGFLGTIWSCCQNERFHKEDMQQATNYIVVRDTIFLSADKDIKGSVPLDSIKSNHK